MRLQKHTFERKVDNSYSVQMEMNEIRDQQIQMILDFVLDLPAVIPVDVEFAPLAEDLLLRLKFAPMGDNHHNARLCPYCTPSEE